MPALTLGWLLFCALNYQAQADTQPFISIWNNPHFIVIDKGILAREVRFSLIKE